MQITLNIVISNHSQLKQQEYRVQFRQHSIILSWFVIGEKKATYYDGK